MYSTVEVSKLVASRWKNIDQSRKLYYKALAAKDKRRYALEKFGKGILQEGGFEELPEEVSRERIVQDAAHVGEVTFPSPAMSVGPGVFLQTDLHEERFSRPPSIGQAQSATRPISTCDQPAIAQVDLAFEVPKNCLALEPVMFDEQRNMPSLPDWATNVSMEPSHHSFGHELTFDRDEVEYLEEAFDIFHHDMSYS